MSPWRGRSSGFAQPTRPPHPAAGLAELARMIDDHAKERLHKNLRTVREAALWKLDGLGEYDIRRPLTWTGTNLLGW